MEKMEQDFGPKSYAVTLFYGPIFSNTDILGSFRLKKVYRIGSCYRVSKIAFSSFNIESAYHGGLNQREK